MPTGGSRWAWGGKVERRHFQTKDEGIMTQKQMRVNSFKGGQNEY